MSGAGPISINYINASGNDVDVSAGGSFEMGYCGCCDTAAVDNLFFADGTPVQNGDTLSIDSIYTPGSVIYAGPDGRLTEENSSFHYSETTNSLGVGGISPGDEIYGATTASNGTASLKLYAGASNGQSTIFLSNNTSTSTGYKGLISVGGSARTTIPRGNELTILSGSSAPIVFCTNGLTQRGVITSAGLWGINQTIPVRTLDINGTIRVTGSAGTPTFLVSRDANGDISNVTSPTRNDTLTNFLALTPSNEVRQTRAVFSGTGFGTTDGSGDITVTLGITMPDATYSVVCTSESTTPQTINIQSKTATNFVARFFDSTGAAITGAGVVLNWMVRDR